ncbi:hypothetical protein GCM10027191_11340 [Novilysobacter erysipheiresistens]
MSGCREWGSRARNLEVLPLVPARAFATQETGMTQPTIGYHGLFVPGPHIVLDDGDIGSISVLTGWSDQM